LILIFVYAFFSFAWAYRCSITSPSCSGDAPAAQRDTPEAEAHVIRTTGLFEGAGGISIAASARSSSRSAISAGRQSLGFVRNDGAGRNRHLAPAVRLRRLARDGGLTLIIALRRARKSCGVKLRSSTFHSPYRSAGNIA